MKWSSALERCEGHVEGAVRQAAQRVVAALGEAPDLALVFLASEDVGDYARAAEALAGELPGTTLIGCSAAGVIGDGREAEHTPALSLTAAVLPGVEVSPFQLAGDEQPDPAGLRGEIGVARDQEPCLLILPNPHGGLVEPLIEALDQAYPGGQVLGGVPSSLDSMGGMALLLGDELRDEGVVGVALTGALRVRTLVSQGCRPVGQPLFVTRAEANLIHELDGRPAHQVLEELLSGMTERELGLARQALFLGITMRESTRVHTTGDFLIRNVLGFEARTRAVAVAARLPEHATVQFQVRDAAASHQDLDQLLEAEARSLGDERPAGAVLFSCLGRGRGLFGVVDHDPGLLRKHLGDVPLGGFFCNGELGPVQGCTYLHGYTSAFGMFYPA